MICASSKNMPSPAPLLASVALTAGALLLGLRAVAARSGDPSLRSLPGAATGAIAAWLALSAGLAHSGVLARFDVAPPRVLLLPLTALASLALLSRTDRMKRLLAATPRAWPIALMSFRLPVELMLWQAYREGAVPRHLTFEGRNFDVLVALSAPLVAWAVARGRLGARAVVVWNVAGLALLANVVGMAVTSVPGPARLDWPGPPMTLVATAPFVWLPAFLVPVAAFGHVLSLLSLRRRPQGAEGGAVALA